MYGVTRALAGVDATFSAGNVTVIEGPNGSGKSTLLHILSQEVRPTGGEVRYGDRRVRRGRLRAQIGVLAHQPMLYPDLTGKENLALFGELYEIDDLDSRIDGLRQRFQVGRYADRPARTWSRGQLQRVALARALLGRPRLLLLDEPSTGLDTQSVDLLSRAIMDERARGAIVILVTHDRAFAEAVGDNTLQLHRGEVLSEAQAIEGVS